MRTDQNSLVFRVVALCSATLICAIVGGCSMGPSHWAEADGTLELDLGSMESVRVVTHNGDIEYSGSAASGRTLHVTFTRRGGGSSDEDALAALEAIAVFGEEKDGTMTIGWRWSQSRKSGWAGRVSFTIDGPHEVTVHGSSHNGDVVVTGVQGAVRSETHNGDIRVTGPTRDVSLKSHNGNLHVVQAGGTVRLSTHNGDMTIDATNCGELGGRVDSHNGNVAVLTGADLSSSVHFTSHNGSVRGSASDVARRLDKKRVQADFGAAAGRLEIETHNGDLTLR